MDLTQINKKDLRGFGIGAAIFFAGIIPFIQYLKHHNPSIILISIGIILGIIGLIFPMVLKPLYYGVMKYFALPLGWINTRIILAIIYYCVFMPVGLLLRLFGKDLLYRKFDKTADSYWILRDGKPFDSNHYEKPY
ncbi:MAG: hypothetical protein HQL25_05690 [Candidatus Omnitrophica bacterium]|nr:hypothetical protein [Candidatus Omnitrophota bacterium]